MIYTTGISIYVLYRGRYQQKLRGLGLLFINFVQILSKFVNTSTRQAYFQRMFSQSLSKSLKSVSCTSVLYSLTLKSIYIGQSNEG